MELIFDAGTVVEDTDFAALPNGEYPCIVKESEFKENKAGTGKYLNLRLDIIDGQYKGRVIFDRLNLQNKNEIAVEIAKKQLAGLCRAAGKIKIKDSSELHNIPVTVRLTFKKGTNGYDDSNDVKKYLPFASATQSTAETTTPFAANSEASDGMPWS